MNNSGKEVLSWGLGIKLLDIRVPGMYDDWQRQMFFVEVDGLQFDSAH